MTSRNLNELKTSIIIFEKLVNAMGNETIEDFDKKIIKILNALE